MAEACGYAVHRKNLGLHGTLQRCWSLLPYQVDFWSITVLGIVPVLASTPFYCLAKLQYR